MSASPWDELSKHQQGGANRDFAQERCSVFDTTADPNFINWPDISRELRDRREYWRNEFTSPRYWRRIRNAGDVFMLGCFVVASFVFLRMVFPTPLAAFLALPIAAVTTLLMSAYRCRGTGRLVRALRLPQCPACSYDVSALSAIPHAQLDGQIIGPDRCPECGTPWPLVPPPVPREQVPLCQTHAS